jgi:two-component system chemotaxis sensor kinase CheA
MVDDTPIYRSQMQMFLSIYKFEVFTAVDGLDALKKLEADSLAKPFDLVITDVEMPNMNGFELLATLKKKYPKLPVIILTTLEKESHIQKAEKLGSDFYIVKPFSKGKIDEALGKIGFK